MSLDRSAGLVIDMRGMGVWVVKEMEVNTAHTGLWGEGMWLCVCGEGTGCVGCGVMGCFCVCVEGIGGVDCGVRGCTCVCVCMCVWKGQVMG